MNKFLSKLGKEYSQYTKARNEIIVRSRDVLKYAKTAIFALHRDEVKVAAKALNDAEKVISKLKPFISANRGLDDEGAYRACLEEYAEAKLFYQYLQTGGLVEIKEVKLDHETYLGAISDLTGELVRRAIAKGTYQDVEALKQYKEFVEQVIMSLGTFDLTSSLRNKYDQAKKNLYKIEEIIYDMYV